MIRLVFAAAVVFALVMPVVAKDRQAQLVTDVPTFLKKQQELRESIESSKKYSHIKPDAKQKIFAAQEKLTHLLAGHTTVEELNVDDKVAVFNAQTDILAQLDQAEPDRVICSTEAKTGSHLHTVTCTTKRERDEQRDKVHSMYNGLQRTCVSITCGGGK